MLMWHDPNQELSPTLDWRVAEDYEYISSLSYRELAWEFLRRNKIFVEDLTKLRKLKLEYENELSNFPLSMPDEEHAKISLDRNSEVKELEDQLAIKFGLSRGVGHQHFDAGAPIFDVKSSGEYGALCLHYHDHGNDMPMWVDEPTRSKMWIDVRIFAETSIGWQLRDVEEMYYKMIHRHLDEEQKARQEKKQRVPKKLYPNYLRVWDAHSEGLKNTDIAKHIYPNETHTDPVSVEKRVSQQLRKTRELINGGYIRIAGEQFRK